MPPALARTTLGHHFSMNWSLGWHLHVVVVVVFGVGEQAPAGFAFRATVLRRHQSAVEVGQQPWALPEFAGGDRSPRD